MTMRASISVTLLLMASSMSAVGATVSADPVNTMVSPGDVFMISITGADFATPVDAGGLDINWDPAALALGPAGFTLGPVWGPLSTTGTPGPGSLTDIFFFADVAPPPALFAIGTVQFQALASGSSPVNLIESALNPFAGGGGQIIGITFSSGNVVVSQVPGEIPEPQTWLLNSAGFVLLGLLRYGVRISRRT